MEVDLQALVHPLAPGVEERLSRREVAVHGPQRDTGTARDQRDRHVLRRRISQHLCEGPQDTQTRLLHLLRPEWTLVGPRRTHVTITVIQDTYPCQEGMYPCR